MRKRFGQRKLQTPGTPGKYFGQFEILSVFKIEAELRNITPSAIGQYCTQVLN